MSRAELTNLESRKRQPWDWYVEQQWVTHRLIDTIHLEDDVTYLDPCCGLGNIPTALIERGLKAFGTDMVPRTDAPFFLGQHDWLGDQRHMLEAEPKLSIIFNPPYSRQNGAQVKGLAERMVRRALEVATHKVCALLPVKWLASQGLHKLFERDHRPTGIWILCERPSMPPGDVIEAMGDKAFAHGKVDYMWIVWDKHFPALPYTPTNWLAPRPGK